MAKMSNLHQRIAERQREKRGFIKSRYFNNGVYRAELVFSDMMAQKTRALSMTIEAVEDMNKAAKINALLTDFDRFELTAAMKLLVSDSAHFDAKMDELLARHESKPIVMQDKALRKDVKLASQRLQFTLEIADEYTAMAQFFTNVVQRDISLLNTIVTRFEYRQDQLAKSKGVTLPA